MRLEDAPVTQDAAFDFSVDENGIYIGDGDEDDWDEDFDEEDVS
jgi:hypothetical protein